MRMAPSVRPPNAANTNAKINSMHGWLRFFVCALWFQLGTPICTTSHDQELTKVSSLDLLQLSVSQAKPTYTLPLIDPAATDFTLYIFPDQDNSARACQSGFVYWEFTEDCPSTVMTLYRQPWSASVAINVPASARTLMFLADFDPENDPGTTLCKLNICAGPDCNTQCKLNEWSACAAEFDECQGIACQCINFYHQCLVAAGCYAGSLVDQVQSECASIDGQCQCPPRPASEQTQPGQGGQSTADGSADKPFYQAGSPFFAAFMAGIILILFFVLLCIVLCCCCLFRRGADDDGDRRGRRGTQRSRRYTGSGGARPRRGTQKRRGSRAGDSFRREDGAELGRSATTGGGGGGGGGGSGKFPCEVCGQQFSDHVDLLMHLGLEHPEITKDRKALTRTVTAPRLN